MYPSLYEINTRPWIKNFGEGATLSHVPDKYWKELKDKGVDYVWLMGIWQTSPASVKLAFHPDLVYAYDQISEKWEIEDVTGSPYAIEEYSISPLLGSMSDLIFVRKQLARFDIKLILDFVPNHFNAYSDLVNKHPEVFLQVDASWLERDEHTFFQRGDRVYAHGKDPYFAAWTDTVQVNYSSQVAQSFMIEQLLHIEKFCDGVRCDMAMLMLPDIFERTWGFTNKVMGGTQDFWSSAIKAVRHQHPGFLFLAEAYWDTPWRLQQIGFDYTYDKMVLDLVREGKVQELKGHLSGTLEYQDKTARFIENHDEERSLTALGDEKARVAAILYNTLPGMRLHYDGQWTGERLRYPVQLGTFFKSDPCQCLISPSIVGKTGLCNCTVAFYDRLMDIVKDPLYKEGNWQMLDTREESSILGMRWKSRTAESVIILNFGNSFARTNLVLGKDSLSGTIEDQINGEIAPEYAIKTDDVLRVRLPGMKGAILRTKS